MTVDGISGRIGQDGFEVAGELSRAIDDKIGLAGVGDEFEDGVAIAIKCRCDLHCAAFRVKAHPRAKDKSNLPRARRIITRVRQILRINFAPLDVPQNKVELVIHLIFGGGAYLCQPW